MIEYTVKVYGNGAKEWYLNGKRITGYGYGYVNFQESTPDILTTPKFKAKWG